ncbi:MAG: M67 family metallopeptidase, partial [Acidobacteriaceae bacterium]|nr:M67 family metallopeptidase [Acidobacteriaceae bacterium]
HECCGVLLGLATDSTREVRSVIPAGNTRLDSLHNRYNIDPGELLRIQRQAREQNLDIVGFYHSHPDHPARWSTTDFAEAHWIGCSYVITSVDQGKASLTNSFALVGTMEEDKKFEDEQIKIVGTGT